MEKLEGKGKSQENLGGFSLKEGFILQNSGSSHL